MPISGPATPTADPERQTVLGFIFGPGLAFAILAVTIAHVPATFGALDCFDPPKRAVWSVLAVLLAFASFRGQHSTSRAIRFSLLACLLWVVVRSMLRERPDVEIDVLMTWILPGLLFGLGLTVDRDTASEFLLLALLLSGGIQIVLMLLQYIGRDPLFAETTAAFAYRPERMIGTIGYHNQAASFLALSSVTLIAVVRIHVVRLLALCAVLAVVCLTGNRAAIVGFSFSILAVEVFAVLSTISDRKRGILRLLVAVVILLAVIGTLFQIMPTTRERFGEVVVNPKRVPALASRATMARIALAMWVEKPVVGWGAGEFAFQYLDRLRDILPAEKTHDVLRNLVFAREAHNDYLQFAAEFGIVGLAILSCLFILVSRVLWRSRVQEPSACAACLFVLAYMILSGMLSFPWQTSLVGPLAAFVLGVMLPREVVPETASPQPGRPPWQLVQYVFFLALSVALLLWNGKVARINTSLPEKLHEGGAAELAKMVPGWMHKYHAIIGAGLARDGAYDEALPELRLAYGGYRDVVLYNNLGHVLSKKALWEEAVQIYREWAESGIDHSKALGNLSIAYEQTGDFENAALILDKRMSLWADHDIGSVQRLATLYLRAGRARDGLRALQGYETNHVSTGDVLPAEYDNLRGSILLVMGDRVAAEESFRSALRKNPQLRSARRNLDQLTQENRSRESRVSPGDPD